MKLVIQMVRHSIWSTRRYFTIEDK